MSSFSQKRGLAALMLLAVAALQACGGQQGLTQQEMLQNAGTAAALNLTQQALNAPPPVQPLNPVNPPAAAAQNPPAGAAPVQQPLSQQPVVPSGGGAACSVPQVSPISSNPPCRSGPDTSFPDTSFLVVGQSAQVAGRNSNNSWWMVRDPQHSGKFCWLAAFTVTTCGNVASVPIMSSGSVSNVDVTFAVNTPVTCGSANNQVFVHGAITADGDATVSSQWELTGDATNTSSPQTQTFGSSGGTQDAPDRGTLNLDCGHYVVTLHVLSPNDFTSSQTIDVQP